MVGDDIRDDALGAQDAGFQVNINVVISIHIVRNIILVYKVFQVLKSYNCPLFQGCLVKTGKYAPGDENIVEDKSPNYIFPSIVEVVDHIIQQSNTI